MIALFTLTNTNPYKVMGLQHYQGLVNIESVLTGSFSYDALLGQITSDIIGFYYPSGSTTALDMELSSVGSLGMETYMSGRLDGYNAEQMYLITSMLSGIITQPIDSIEAFLIDIRQNIDRSGLTLQERIPLYFGVEIALQDYAYWIAAVNNLTNNWYTTGYFSADKYANYINIPHWVYACTFGTLACANKSKTYGLVDPPPVIGSDIVSALYASLTLAAGKVLYKWIQRPEPYSSR